MRFKHLLVVPVLALIGSLAGSVPFQAYAVGPLDTNYATGFRVQNLGSEPAACSYQLFDNGGNVAFSATLPDIAVNDNAFVYTPNVAGLPSGKFSAIISCNKPVAAVVGFSNSTSGDAYVGFNTPQSSAFVPSVYNDYYNYVTSFRVQEASGIGQNVRVEYFAPGNATPVRTDQISLAANGTADINQDGMSGLNKNVAYSARLSSLSSGLIAVLVNINGKAGTAVAPQLNAFQGLGAGATTKIYTPIRIHNYYGYNSAATIQNTGTADAQVAHTYTLNGNAVKSENFVIPAGSSRVVLDLFDPALQTNKLYGGTIQSTNGQPLLVTVNESTPSTNRAVTYIGQATGGRTLIAPTVVKTYYGYNSSVTCQNVGASNTSISIAYTGRSGSTFVNTAAKVVAAGLITGAASQIYPPSDPQLPNGFGGSAVITADASDIMCVVNTDQNYGDPAGQSIDKMEGYNAIIKN